MHTGCKSSKVMESNYVKPVPSSYIGTKDSVNSATVSWKSLFTDETLIQLVDTALKNNLDLLITMQNIEAAKANARLAHRSLFPSFGLSASAAQRKFGLYTMDGSGNATTEITPGQLIPIHLPDYYLGLQTSWELDIWGKLCNKKKAALARYLSTIEGRNLTLTNLIAEIGTSYYELLALDNELDIITETITLQQNALNLVNVQKQAGVANDLVINQFEAQLNNLKALEIGTQQQIAEEEIRLNMLLGTYSNPVKRDKEKLLSAVPPQLQIGIPSDMLKNRPDIKQAELEVAASRADVKAAKAAFFPSLNITGGVGYQAFNPSYLFISPQSIAYGLIGSLTAPLINRAAIEADFKTAKASQLQALYNYQKSILNGYAEVSKELLLIGNLEKIANYKTKETTSLTKATTNATLLFKTGRANYLEILSAQQNALQSKLEFVDTKKMQHQSVLNLYKALGGGWR